MIVVSALQMVAETGITWINLLHINLKKLMIPKG